MAYSNKKATEGMDNDVPTGEHPIEPVTWKQAAGGMDDLLLKIKPKPSEDEEAAAEIGIHHSTAKIIEDRHPISGDKEGNSNEQHGITPAIPDNEQNGIEQTKSVDEQIKNEVSRQWREFIEEQEKVAGKKSEHERDDGFER